MSELTSKPAIQSMILICLHEFACGRHFAAWTLSALIAKSFRIEAVVQNDLCFSLSRQVGISGNSAWLEVEENRRLAWACYLQERIFTGGPASTMLFQADDITLCLPCSERNFTLLIPVNSEHLDDIPRAESDDTSLLGCLIRIFVLQSNAQR